MSGKSFRGATRAPKFLGALLDHKAGAAAFSSEISSHRAVGAIPTMAPVLTRRIFSMFREVGKGTQSCLGISHISTSPSLSFAEADGTFVKRLPVQVGASVKIDFSRMEAGVNVNVLAGDNLEEVRLEPSSAMMEGSKCGWEHIDITTSERVVHVRQREVQRPGLELPTLQTMNAHMPARWCSLDVLTGLGSVYVQNVREGSLSVRTSGGHVTLGEMRGSEACINSGGGDVTANLVQAKSSIETGGGKLWVRRIQGTSIAVDSGGGNVVLGSLYGDEVAVQSKGGSVEAKEIQAQERGLVSSNGGSVVIDGIDGKVAVVSGGGNIDLQLNEHAQVVTIDAGKDGRVVLSLSARLTAQLRYEGVHGVVQEGSILSSGDGFGMYEFKGLESAATREATKSGWRGSENYLQSGVAACKIHISSAREVHVKQRSWLELVTSRVS